MPFVEYMLLAILGSAPVAPTGGTPSGRAFPAGTITQPSGAVARDLDLNAGIALAVQNTAGCHGRNVGGGGKKPVRHMESSRRRRAYPPDPVARVRTKRHRRNRGHHRQSKGVSVHDHGADKSATQKF